MREHERRRPRRLRFTREGKILVAIAFAVGFAAINTGHNLLFFGWGLVLSAIVTSGVLSEATLRSLRARPRRPDELRARALSPLPLLVENPGRRLPALGVDVELVVERGGERDGPPTESAVAAPYLLRVGPREEEALLVPWVPLARGRYLVTAARARTTYPFGFFEKNRTLRFDPPLAVEVFPGRLELGPVARALLSRLGDTPSGQKGQGDEFFSLRPYAAGDDPRAIAWRRSARTGRLVTREQEAHGARELILELRFPEPTHRALPVSLREDAFAALGSLAEDLLASGAVVGVRTAGVWLPPGAGPRQRTAILAALATASAADPLPDDEGSPRAARVALSLPGFALASGADHVIDLAHAGLGGAPPPSRARAA